MTGRVIVDRSTRVALEAIPARLRELRRDNDALLGKIVAALAANDWDAYDIACAMFMAHVDVVQRALDDAHGVLDRAWAAAV